MIDLLTPAMIVAALKNVKEFHIDIIDLSWKMMDAKGKLDPVKTTAHRKEIDEAADQAEAYIKSNKKALARIKLFNQRSYNVGG